jgi:hypothetical protein
MSPTQRALKLLRGRGWKCTITEKWVSFGGRKDQSGRTGVRQDAFGFGDLLAMDTYTGRIVLVQVTSGSNHSARKNKILSIPEAKDWIVSGGWILLISFTKKKNRYVTREEWIEV